MESLSSHMRFLEEILLLQTNQYRSKYKFSLFIGVQESVPLSNGLSLLEIRKKLCYSTTTV